MAAGAEVETAATAVLRVEREMPRPDRLVGEVAVCREVIHVLRQLETPGNEGPAEEEHHGKDRNPSHDT